MQDAGSRPEVMQRFSARFSGDCAAFCDSKLVAALSKAFCACACSSAARLARVCSARLWKAWLCPFACAMSCAYSAESVGGKTF
jgi:hypothetical protein